MNNKQVTAECKQLFAHVCGIIPDNTELVEERREALKEMFIEWVTTIGCEVSKDDVGVMREIYWQFDTFLKLAGKVHFSEFKALLNDI